VIRLFVTDVDGVLTDGRLDYGVSCEDRKTFDVKDGQGVVMLMQRGVTVAFVTGRRTHGSGGGERRHPPERRTRSVQGRGQACPAAQRRSRGLTLAR
jgi:hypothetical protein